MQTISRLLFGLVLVIGTVACGSDGGTAPPPPPCPANTICMTGGAFYTTPTSVPTSLTVAVSTPVAWLNNSGVFHNVTFANPFAARAVGTGGSGNIAEHISGSNSRQFDATGTYSFDCTLHFGMAGTVVVQ